MWSGEDWVRKQKIISRILGIVLPLLLLTTVFSPVALAVSSSGDEVRVVIERVPGNLDAATEAAVALRATVETSYQDLLQVIIPISELTALTDAHGTVLQNAIYWWSGTGYNLGTTAPLESGFGFWVLAYEECQLVILPPDS